MRHAQLGSRPERGRGIRMSSTPQAKLARRGPQGGKGVLSVVEAALAKVAIVFALKMRALALDEAVAFPLENGIAVAKAAAWREADVETVTVLVEVIFVSPLPVKGSAAPKLASTPHLLFFF